MSLADSENNLWSSFNSFLGILVLIFFAFFIHIKLNQESNNNGNIVPQKETVEMSEVKTLRYWAVCINQWNPAGNLRTMDRVFKSLQYKFINRSLGEDWDVLWSIEHPYSDLNKNVSIFHEFSNQTLRREQKVNHFPGVASLVSKSYMSSLNSHLSYILPSFVLPADQENFEEFLESNPNTTFVEKNFFNRGVKIVNVTDISAEKPEVFYQQFLDKPFLIDGHAFDIGVYVLITSFDPMRIYRYNADILMRFCNQKYHPFDPKIRNKYVVKEGSHPPNVMPTFKEIYRKYRYPFRKMLENYIEENGFDVDEIWRKIDDAIVSTVLNAEFSVIDKLKDRNCSSHHFFELVRYDFMFDAKMNVYLMEVNMSPNLTPTEKKYEQYTLIYEQLIFNVLKMVGGGSYFEFMSRFNVSDITIASRKNIAVDIKSCLKNECHKNCSQQKCQICQRCITAKNVYQMREAFREHLYEGNFYRIFPTLNHFEDIELYDKMTKSNRISIDWFRAKCKDDEKWC